MRSCLSSTPRFAHHVYSSLVSFVVENRVNGGKESATTLIILFFVAYRLHLSHCLLSILAELEDTRPFEDLRNAYNSVRGKGAMKAPAHEKWAMVGFCDHIFCRWALYRYRAVSLLFSRPAANL